MPRTTLEQTTDRLDYPLPAEWTDATKLVSDFTNEPDFIRRLHQRNVTPHDTASGGYGYELSRYCREFCDVNRPLLDPEIAARLRIIGDSPAMVHVQAEINQLEHTRRQRRLSHEEKTYLNDDLKKFAVDYNQQLSDFMLEHPDEKFSDIARAITDSTLDYYPRRETEVEYGLGAVAKGARYEAVTRQILERTPIDFRPGTNDEDRKGGDIAIMYNGEKILVDIKSSLDEIAKLYGGYDQMTEKGVMYAISPPRKDERYGSIKLFPGFTTDNLGDSCSLPVSMIEDKATMLAIQLQRALNELGL